MYGAPWVSPSPASKYGGSFLSDRCDPGAAASGLEGVAGSPPGHHAAHWHPDSPLFWVAGLVLVVFGIGGAATTVRLGPAKAGVSVGKP